MPKLLKISITLTIFIIMPMMLTNTVLSYLRRFDYHLEWILLVITGAMLAATIGYLLKAHPGYREIKKASKQP
jgi:SNF family Na+-dependent transporter